MHHTLTILAVFAAFLVILLSTCSAVPLVELHGADGHRVFVNPNEISTLREPLDADLHRYFPRGTHCVVVTSNGKFVAVAEYCPAIRELMR